ncbi:MAG: hypothetical protein HQL51_11710, partial [Magnetococcales bacterium]|nr:hypothetical protein [Magnetococcales bacterium]
MIQRLSAATLGLLALSGAGCAPPPPVEHHPIYENVTWHPSRVERVEYREPVVYHETRIINIAPPPRPVVDVHRTVIHQVQAPPPPPSHVVFQGGNRVEVRQVGAPPRHGEHDKARQDREKREESSRHGFRQEMEQRAASPAAPPRGFRPREERRPELIRTGAGGPPPQVIGGGEINRRPEVLPQGERPFQAPGQVRPEGERREVGPGSPRPGGAGRERRHGASLEETPDQPAAALGALPVAPDAKPQESVVVAMNAPALPATAPETAAKAPEVARNHPEPLGKTPEKGMEKIPEPLGKSPDWVREKAPEPPRSPRRSWRKRPQSPSASPRRSWRKRPPSPCASPRKRRSRPPSPRQNLR